MPVRLRLPPPMLADLLSTAETEMLHQLGASTARRSGLRSTRINVGYFRCAISAQAITVLPGPGRGDEHTAVVREQLRPRSAAPSSSIVGRTSSVSGSR